MKSKKGKRDTNIVIVDCSNLIYAAYHTTGTLSWEGRPTGVIFGFLKKILMLSQKFKTNKFITCWDSGITYRHTDYIGYKKNRIQKKEDASEEEKEDMNSIKLQSIELRKEILPNLGFMNNHFQKGFEADDLLAWWVEKLFWQGERNIIMATSDNDLYQCLGKCKIYSIIKKKMFTKEHLLKDYGIVPEKWSFAKAIGGCSGDEVIGIDGASDPKNQSSYALKYIRGELKKGVIYDRITSPKGRKIISKNLPIVTCPYRPEDLTTMIRRRNKYSRKKFLRVFDSLHFKSFLKKDELAKWKDAFLR